MVEEKLFSLGVNFFALGSTIKLYSHLYVGKKEEDLRIVSMEENVLLYVLRLCKM